MWLKRLAEQFKTVPSAMVGITLNSTSDFGS